MTATPSLSRVVWQSKEDVTGTDFDRGQPDLYMTRNGQTTQLTMAQIPSFASVDPFFLVTISADGIRVGFQTNQQLVFADNDGGAQDVYENINGLVRLASAGGSGPVSLRGMSSDGSRIFMSTTAQLLAADTDAVTDLYERVNGTTTNLLTPATALAADWAGASTDGSHVFFHTGESLNAVLDTDARRDVYERAAGLTVLVSTSATAGNGAFDASFQRASADGTRVIFTTVEALDPADHDGDGGDPSTTSTCAPRRHDDGHRRRHVRLADHRRRDVARRADVFWWSNQTFADDEDAGHADAWRWNDGTITRISVGEQDDQRRPRRLLRRPRRRQLELRLPERGPAHRRRHRSPRRPVPARRHDDATAVADPRRTVHRRAGLEPLHPRLQGHQRRRLAHLVHRGREPASRRRRRHRRRSGDHRRARGQSNTDVYESRVLGTPRSARRRPRTSTSRATRRPIEPDLTITETSNDIFGATVAITAGFEADRRIRVRRTARLRRLANERAAR